MSPNLTQRLGIKFQYILKMPAFLILSAIFVLFLSGCNFTSIPGDKNAFDPVEMAPVIQSMIGDSYHLKSLTAHGVKPDGTIDLLDKLIGGSVEYDFIRETDRPKDHPPLGAGGSPERIWHQEGKVQVKRPTFGLLSFSLGCNILENVPHPGPAGDAMVLPACNFADLWKTAIDKGAPEDAVATISYEIVNQKDTYRFSIRGTDIDIMFSLDCKPF